MCVAHPLTDEFPWLPKKSERGAGPLGIIFRCGTKTVYSHLHFSVYGKFAEQKLQQATAIGALLFKG